MANCVLRLVEVDCIYSIWQVGLEAYWMAVKEVLEEVGKGNGMEWENSFPVEIDLNWGRYQRVCKGLTNTPFEFCLSYVIILGFR